MDAEQMKSLISQAVAATALALVAIGHASAVDYIKCEAMQKALGRLQVSKNQDQKAVWKRLLEEQGLAACGPRQSDILWLSCSNNLPMDQIRIRLKEEVTDVWDERITKVNADIAAEGCY